MTMTTKILIWMVAGLVLGSLINAFASDVAFIQDYFVNGLIHVVGTMFITGLKMLVVPLVTFSLTCGVYGIGDGFYIVWPILGASTLRDSVGRLGDAPMDPRNYVQPTEAALAIRSYETVNRLSFRIEDLDDAKKAAFDPYQAARDFYIQSRQTRIKR